MAPCEIRVQVQHILILITNRLLPGDSKGFPQSQHTTRKAPVNKAILPLPKHIK